MNERRPFMQLRYSTRQLIRKLVCRTFLLQFLRTLLPTSQPVVSPGIGGIDDPGPLGTFGFLPVTAKVSN